MTSIRVCATVLALAMSVSVGCSSSDSATSDSSSPDGQAPNDGDAGADAEPQIPPSAPGEVVATADTAGGARVVWKAPADIGSSAISSYTITASPGGATFTTKSAVLEGVVLGLTAGTSYTFVVKATNAAGAGPDSAPSAAVSVVDSTLVPTVLAACAGTSKVTLSAMPVATATAYRAYYATTPGVTRATGTRVDGVAFPYVTSAGLTVDKTYYFVFTAVGPDGIESVESNESSATPRVGMADSAFASSYSAATVTISDCFSKTVNGVSGVTRTLTGNATLLTTSTNYGNVFADPVNKRLYVTTRLPAAQILEWENADTINGNIAPTRVIAGAATGLTACQLGSIAVDASRNRIYAGCRSSAIRIWANANTTTGDVAPTAVISGVTTTLGDDVQQLYLDEPHDRLYVANDSSGATSVVSVFDNVSTLTGAQDIAPTRSINVAGWDIRGVSVDPVRDMLYVASREADGAIYVVNNASTANGTVVANRTITGLTLLKQMMTVQIAGNTLLAFNDSASDFRVFENASTVNGAAAPTRSIPIGMANGGGFFYAP